MAKKKKAKKPQKQRANLLKNTKRIIENAAIIKKIQATF
jgi:hypothetical protein